VRKPQDALHLVDLDSYTSHQRPENNDDLAAGEPVRQVSSPEQPAAWRLKSVYRLYR
jgi:hypothetical protein